MIFDLRIYTLHNNRFAAWLKLYEEHGHPTQVKHCGEPVFYATSEVGPLNQVVHVWKYASQALTRARSAAFSSRPRSRHCEKSLRHGPSGGAFALADDSRLLVENAWH